MRDRDVIIRLLKLLKIHTRSIIFIFICLFISAGINIALPLISKEIMDKGFINGDYNLLIILALTSFVLYGFEGVINLIKEKKRIDVSTSLQYDLTDNAFNHLMKVKDEYFSNMNYAQILSNVDNDIDSMAGIADENMFFIITEIFSIIGGIIGLLILSGKLTLIVLIFIPVKMIIVHYFTKRNMSVIMNSINAGSEYAKWFGDTVGGVREVKLFNLIVHKQREFKKLQNNIIECKKKKGMLQKLNEIVDNYLIEFLMLFIYIIGGKLILNQSITVGSIFAFITYAVYVTGPISAILNISYMLSGIIPSAKRYYEFLDLKEENQGEDLYDLSNGDIVFKYVDFSYDESRKILDKMFIHFKKGRKGAIIGQNGSGKTTLIKLLLRMCEPDNGGIYVDGVNINDIDIMKYRKMFAVVSQQIYLFNDTVKNNICLSKNIDDDYLMQIIKECDLEEFIEKNTMDYVVGENGATISGGEKQKIALARALIQESSFVIFDEVTSNTDAIMEVKMDQLLETRLKKKTVILITHKFDILSKMDDIYYLDKGRVVFCGTYRELVQNKECMLMLNEE